MDWILVCFLPHPENICHWRSSVTIKNIIFSETFYCFELESRFTQKTPPGGWKLFINIFYSARDREIWIDLGNLLLPPHRSSTAPLVVYLYVCRASDICIFVYLYQYTLCILVPRWAANKRPAQPAPASTHQQSNVSFFCVTRQCAVVWWDRTPAVLTTQHCADCTSNVLFLNTYHGPFFGAT